MISKQEFSHLYHLFTTKKIPLDLQYRTPKSIRKVTGVHNLRFYFNRFFGGLTKMKELQRSVLTVFILVFLCLISQAADNLSTGWNTSGSATIDGNKVIITPADYELAGMAWFKKEIDLSLDFDLQFKIYLGTEDEEGADGIVFVLASNTAEQIPGQDLGYTGIMPSFAMEIDTHPNDGEHIGFDLNDPLDDHLAIDYNGTANHYDLETQPVEVGNLEDGTEHALRITWNAKANKFDAFLDNSKTPTLSYAGDIAGNFLEGKKKVMMGFTGSTGMACNLQYVIPVDVIATNVVKPITVKPVK